jgi:hypothetical protein
MLDQTSAWKRRYIGRAALTEGYASKEQMQVRAGQVVRVSVVVTDCP